jgi:hypothetical protein
MLRIKMWLFYAYTLDSYHLMDGVLVERNRLCILAVF